MTRIVPVLRILLLLTLSTSLNACIAPTRPERLDPGRRVYVLAGADEELDRAIADAERAAPRVEPSRLASLRLTREAKDLIGEGQTDRALDLLERAIEQNGEQGFSYLYLADVYINAGDVSQGLVFLDRAEALLPSSPQLQSVTTSLLARASEIAAIRKSGEP